MCGTHCGEDLRSSESPTRSRTQQLANYGLQLISRLNLGFKCPKDALTQQADCTNGLRSDSETNAITTERRQITGDAHHQHSNAEAVTSARDELITDVIDWQ